MTVQLATPAAFMDRIGESLGASEWFTVTQSHLDDFAHLTGDDFWIHVDTARAAREMPQGKTIAHGLFALSLVPRMQRDIFHIETRGRGLNYGTDRVRYTAAMPVGCRLRLHQSVLAAARQGVGTKVTLRCTMEIEGSERPAFVADCIVLFEDAAPA